MSSDVQGEPIGAHGPQVCVPASLNEGHEDARLAMSRVVQATRAGLAEMEHLLDRAERLITQTRSHRRSMRVLERGTDPVWASLLREWARSGIPCDATTPPA
jgi:hypothetical protein